MIHLSPIMNFPRFSYFFLFLFLCLFFKFSHQIRRSGIGRISAPAVRRPSWPDGVAKKSKTEGCWAKTRRNQLISRGVQVRAKEKSCGSWGMQPWIYTGKATLLFFILCCPLPAAVCPLRNLANGIIYVIPMVLKPIHWNQSVTFIMVPVLCLTHEGANHEIGAGASLELSDKWHTKKGPGDDGIYEAILNNLLINKPRLISLAHVPSQQTSTQTRKGSSGGFVRGETRALPIECVMLSSWRIKPSAKLL